MSPRSKSDPPKAQGFSRLKLILFVCMVLAACWCWYLLADFTSTNAQALTGELTLSGSAAAPVPQGSGLIAFLFDYCGSFTYVLPLFVIFSGWVLFLQRVRIKSIDFFAVGLRILGVNTFILGCTALFSAVGSRGSTGAGGILGDFLNLILQALLPSGLSTAVAALFAAIGFFLLIGQNPLQLCENLGALFFSLAGRVRGKKVRAQAAAEQPRSAAEPELVVREMPAPEAAPAAAAASQEAPASGHDQSQSQLTGLAALKSRLFKRSEAEHSLEPPLNSDHSHSSIASSQPDSNQEPAAVLHEPHDRREPSFGESEVPPGASSFGAAAALVGGIPASGSFELDPTGIGSLRPAEGMVSSPSPAAVQAVPPESVIALTSTGAPVGQAPASENKDQGVSTIITRSLPPEMQAAQAEPPADYAAQQTDAYGQENAEAPVSTIITKNEGPLLSADQTQPNILGNPAAGSADAVSEEDNVTHTVITYHEPQVQPAEISEVDDPNVVHTHIFKGGMPGPAAPINAVQAVYDPNAGVSAVPSAAAPSGSLAAPSDAELADSAESYGPVQVKSVPAGDSGILSFDDLIKGEQEQARAPSFEMNTLPAGVSAQQGEAGEPFLKDDKEHISEKDLAERYPQASRGVMGTASAPQAASASPAPEASAASAPEASEPQSISGSQMPPASETAAPQAESAPETSVFEAPVQPQSVSMAVQGQNSNTSNLPSYMQTADNSKGADEPAPGTAQAASGSLCSISAPKTYYDAWRPSVDLLTPPEKSDEIPKAEFERMANNINAFFQDFNVKARIVGWRDGPVITTYAVELDRGVRFSAVENLVTDLCRVLKVLPNSVRALSSLPGTIYAGLEVPSPRRRLITLHEVASSPEFAGTKAVLPLCLGENTEGRPVIVDLAEAPHLLIAGTTGSGKSAGLNSMLISLLLKRSPAELRLILIDPKRLEFKPYDHLPHLITPVITDVAEKTSMALQWCIGEMERRYALIESFKVRKLSEYNAIIKEARLKGEVVRDEAGNEYTELPYIVVVIEEFADLMAQTSSRGKKGGDSPEAAIARLTAKSRACGIHIMLATQSPRADVLTGVIKANMPSRIGFTVQSYTESRIILDETGAECLLGLGDMICKFNGYNRNTSFRAHGAFVTNSDVQRVVDEWRLHGEPEFVEGVTENPFEAEGMPAGDLDPFFDRAAACAREYYQRKQKAVPISEIQTLLGVGYPRAKKLFNQLERAGMLES